MVLGIRSPYFDDALQSKFKEGITHEFSFERDSPHALWRVLQYMYTGEYSDEPFESLDSKGLLPLVRDANTNTKQMTISNCSDTHEYMLLRTCFGRRI